MLGDFNIDLLKYDLSDSIDIIDTLAFNFLLLHILLPTRISKISTLIDNIFSNSTSLEEIQLKLSHQHFQIISYKLFFKRFGMTGENLKIKKKLFLILIKWIGIKFYAMRKVMLTFQ